MKALVWRGRRRAGYGQCRRGIAASAKPGRGTKAALIGRIPLIEDKIIPQSHWCAATSDPACDEVAHRALYYCVVRRYSKLRVWVDGRFKQG